MSKQSLFSESLRRAIEQSSMSRYEIAKRSGISQAALSLYVNGKAGLSTNTIDQLAPVLGLRLVVEKPKQSKVKKPE